MRYEEVWQVLDRLGRHSSLMSDSFCCILGVFSSSFFTSFSWLCANCFRISLKRDEFLVTGCKPLLAVTIVAFFSSATKGFGLYGVLNVLCLGCRMNITSPGLIFLSWAYALRSAYISFSASSSHLSGRCWLVVLEAYISVAYIVTGNSSNVVLRFLLFKASHGDTLVVEWGAARYWRKNSYSSCFQFLPSRWAILMDFSRVCTRRSTSLFAFAQYGVIPLCLNPGYSERFLNLWPLNGGPLSLLRTAGRHYLSCKYCT